MPLTNYVKNGFANIRLLMQSLAADLIDTQYTQNGVQYFECVYPPGFAVGTMPFPSGVAYPAGNVLIFESRNAIDPLANANVVITPTGNINAAWRLGFVLHDDVTLTAHAGTRLNLPGIENPDPTVQGKLTFLTNRSSDPNTLLFREPPGCINVEPWSYVNNTTSTRRTIFSNLATASVPGRTIASDLAFPGPNVQLPAQSFISRLSSVGAESSYPMNYSLTLSNRGMVLAVWEDNQEEIPEQNVLLNNPPNTGYTDSSQVYGNSPVRWFVIQRAVDREKGQVRGGYSLRNGKPYSSGVIVNEVSRCPVFCVFGNANPNQYRKFVVRENDTLTPSPKRNASVNTVDSPAIINPLPQQSVTEQGEFVVTFLNNLSTARFRYGDELDLVGTVGAEVVGAGTEITVKVYQDTYNRTYSAVYSNKQYGNGMRIMMLTKADYRDENTNTGLAITSGNASNLGDLQY